MTSRRTSTLVAALAGVLTGVLAGTSPAAAQEEDWDIMRDPAQRLVMAHLSLSSGLALAVRCRQGRLDAVLAGLPAAPGREQTRILRLTEGEDEAYDSTWNVTTDRTVAIADYPAAMARTWRKGERFQVAIAGGGSDGRTLRHDIALPPSSAAIGEALTACGKPLEDPRDALLPDVPVGGLSSPARWVRGPRPEFPNAGRFASGYAIITCVAQPTGSLDECVIESEHPQDGGFGEAALKAARRGQVAIDGEQPGQYSPRLIGFRTLFRLE